MAKPAGIAKETEDFSGEMQSTTASWSWSKPGYNWSNWPSWGANSEVLGSCLVSRTLGTRQRCALLMGRWYVCGTVRVGWGGVGVLITFKYTSTHTSCYATARFSCTCTHRSCLRYCTFLLHLHTHVMLCYCTFLLHFHTHVMLRYCTFLLHLHTHVMLRYCTFLLHFHTHVMQRLGGVGGVVTFKYTSTHKSCYATARSSCTCTHTRHATFVGIHIPVRLPT